MLDADSIVNGSRSRINFDPQDLVRELVAFGEIDAAQRITELSPRAIEAIGVLAARHLSAPDRPFIDKAICLGTVEFIEGKARPLARKRRTYPKAP